MRNFKIVTDASCDLPAELVEQLNITVVPMGMVLDNKDYKHHYNWKELSKDNYYNTLRNGAKGSTSGTNIKDAIDTMKPIVESGEDILYLSLSSGLSCSYQNACLAAAELLDDYPDVRIEVVDTKCVCLGVGILVYMAAHKQMAGESIDDVLSWVRNNCAKVHHYFAVDDLSALQRSGRISHLTSIVGSVIGVKPMFTIGSDGKVQNNGKIRGRKASIRQIMKDTKENVKDSHIFAICHADTEIDANILKDELLKEYPHATIIVGNIGPIIGINTGVNTIAIICFGKDR